jgi:hypothetical protein
MILSRRRTIGLDLAKNVFHAHGSDASRAVLFRKKFAAITYFGSLLLSQPARLPWKRAPAAITGRGRLRSWGTMSG